MALVSIPAGSHRVLVEAPAGDFLRDLAGFFPFATPASAGVAPIVVAREADGERYAVSSPWAVSRTGLTRGQAIELVRRAATMAIVADGGTALRAAATVWMDKGVLIVAPPGTGKTTLNAWLIEEGFAYVADDLAVIAADGVHLSGLAGPLALRADSVAPVVSLPAFRNAGSLRSDNIVLVRPEPAWLYAQDALAPVGLVLFPRFNDGQATSIAPLAPADVAGRLADASYQALSATDARRTALVALADRVPGFAIEYGSFDGIDGVLSELAAFVVEGELSPLATARFLTGFARGAADVIAPARMPIPPATDRHLHPRLTIGMPTYDDYDGVYFTIQAIRMYHPEILSEVELVVVDNHPDGLAAPALKALENSIANFRYVPYPEAVGSAAAKNRVFVEAEGEFVLCMDCHVFVVPGALKRLLDYFTANRTTRDLLQGPLVYDDLKKTDTHFAPTWRGGMWGIWAHDPRGDDPNGLPFEIPMQGLGLFACRKDAWPGFNPAFRGFGGEEGYIHERVRRNGARTLCLPFLRWIHRFNRPFGPRYPNVWEERCRNYVIGFRELGLSTTEMEVHFAELLGAPAADRMFAQIRRELDPPRG